MFQSFTSKRATTLLTPYASTGAAKKCSGMTKMRLSLLAALCLLASTITANGFFETNSLLHALGTPALSIGLLGAACLLVFQWLKVGRLMATTPLALRAIGRLAWISAQTWATNLSTSLAKREYFRQSLAVVGLMLFGLSSLVAQSTNFESFTLGTVHYQGTGATVNTGPPGNYIIPNPYGSLWTVSDEWGFTGAFDQSVEDDGTGNKVWRMSNAVTTTGFSNLPNSPSSALPAGETTAALYNDRGDNHTMPLAPPNPRASAASQYFHCGFRFKSATGAPQAGLALNFSPTPKQSNVRMSFVGITDNGSTGFNLNFFETLAGGTFSSSIPLASDLSYTDWHQLDIYIEFVDGLNGDGTGNDIVKIVLNGALVYTGTTWETFYASAAWTATPDPIAVDALMFRASGTAVPANSGNGIYFDDVTYDNMPIPSVLVLDCPMDATEAACQDQTDIDAAFAAWVASATVSGSCADAPLGWQVQSDYFGERNAIAQTRTIRSMAVSKDGGSVYTGYIQSPNVGTNAIRRVTSDILAVPGTDHVIFGNGMPGGTGGFGQVGGQPVYAGGATGTFLNWADTPNSPRSMDTDDRGYLYVAFTSGISPANVVRIYSADLSTVLGALSISNPTGVAAQKIGADYFMYVNDGNTLRRYNVTNLPTITQDMSYSPPPMTGGAGLVVDTVGVAYVTGNNQVRRVSADGTSITHTVTLNNSADAALFKDTVYVIRQASPAQPITRYIKTDLSSAGTDIVTPELGAFTRGSLSQLTAIDISSDGKIYVSEENYTAGGNGLPTYTPPATTFNPTPGAIVGRVYFDRVLVSSPIEPFVINNDAAAAPPACGGSVDVTWTVSSDCASDMTCSATFTVTAAPAVVLTCPMDAMEASCQTQTEIDDAFALWLTSATASGGCNTTVTNDATMAPPSVGGSVMVTFTASSDCEADVTCTRTFTVESCFTITGNIVWEHDRIANPVGVPDAEVELAGDDTGSDDTDAAGDYAIPTVGGSSLTLTPTKTTGSPYDGVDAADVTRIQQHVTFIDRFDDGYKVIAADVNQSNSVTGLDAAVLFHAINGNPNAQTIFENPSWRFVDSTHTFMDENNPWPFPDTIALMNVMASILNQSFVGAKMGDVNGTWGTPLAPLAAPLNWTVPNLTLKAGQKLRIPFRADGLPDVAAWQFALRFDTDYLRFERALPTAAFPLKDENFGAWQAEQGELRSVFAVPQGLVLPKDETIFELEFQVVYDGLRLSEVLRLDNGILDGRVYNTALSGGAVALAFERDSKLPSMELPSEAALGFALEQNIPNPFGNETLVRFELPEAGEAVFSVHDVQGRLLYEQRGFLDAGLHEVRLDAERLGATGVLSYTLRSGKHNATRRMVLVR